MRKSNIKLLLKNIIWRITISLLFLKCSKNFKAKPFYLITSNAKSSFKKRLSEIYLIEA